MYPTHDTDWSLSAKGNKWRRNKGKVLVVGKRKDGTYWARADSKYLSGHFNSELMAKIALDMDWHDFADVPSGGQK